MKKTKKQHNNQAVVMPAPAGWQKLIDKKPSKDEERENCDKEIISGGIEEKLVEEVGAKLDAYMELTGEPISVILTFAHHAIEIFSLVADVSSGINKSRPIRTVIIPPHPSIEDQEEEFTNI